MILIYIPVCTLSLTICKEFRQAMARIAKFTEKTVETAQLYVKDAETARDSRTGLSILISKICGASNTNTVDVLGVGKATVVWMQEEIRDQAAGNSKQKVPWGVRRRGHFSFEQEKEFLDPWIEKAECGGILDVPPIHTAYEEQIGCGLAPLRFTVCWLGMAGERSPRILATRKEMRKLKQTLIKFQETVAQAAEQNDLNLPLRVMFQDEARFGRVSDPRRCWAPAPLRPIVPVAVHFAYAAVSPQDGALDWMLTVKMGTLNMNAFLDHISQRHADGYIVMVLDGALSHGLMICVFLGTWHW